jgi:putative transposase
MGWNETCAMEERFKFIEEYKRECDSVAELGRGYGISRKTGYKGLERYEEAGLEGLRGHDLCRHDCRHGKLKLALRGLIGPYWESFITQ